MECAKLTSKLQLYMTQDNICGFKRPCKYVTHSGPKTRFIVFPQAEDSLESRQKFRISLARMPNYTRIVLARQDLLKSARSSRPRHQRTQYPNSIAQRRNEHQSGLTNQTQDQGFSAFTALTAVKDVLQLRLGIELVVQLRRVRWCDW